MWRNFICWDLHNVPGNFVIAVVVSFVSELSVLVPLTGEHALSAQRLKTEAHPANTGEQVDKSKGRLAWISWLNRQGLRRIQPRRGLRFLRWACGFIRNGRHGYGKPFWVAFRARLCCGRVVETEGMGHSGR